MTPDKCQKCGRKSSVNLRHIGPMCRCCFLEVIEKRVRKELRTGKLIRKNDRILFIDNGSKEFKVGYALLTSIIKDLPVKISIKKSKSIAASSALSKKYDKIIAPWSLEDEDEQFLDFLFSRKKPKQMCRNAVKLLMNISEDEISAFAAIKGFKFREKPKSAVRKILDSLEKRYPGYKFSLLNSIKAVSPY